MTADEFNTLQAFRREYLIDETARPHTAVLRVGRDQTAATAIDATLATRPRV